MKKVAPTDTVFHEDSRKMCVEFVCIYAFFPVFWQGKLRKIAKNACQKGLKSLDISSSPSEVTMGWEKNPGILGFFGIKIPKSRWKLLKNSNPNFRPSRKSVFHFSLNSTYAIYPRLSHPKYIRKKWHGLCHSTRGPIGPSY